MEIVQEFFTCDACDNKNFKRIYNFSLRFHDINFSDDLVYDKMIDEKYKCTECSKTFTRDEIEACLSIIKKRHKYKDTE